MESTSTIIKIRNSDKIKIITEKYTGEIKETDFTNKCDLACDEGVKALNEFLTKTTDMTSSEECVQYKGVDIGLPVPFLKVNHTLSTLFK